MASTTEQRRAAASSVQPQKGEEWIEAVNRALEAQADLISGALTMWRRFFTTYVEISSNVFSATARATVRSSGEVATRTAEVATREMDEALTDAMKQARERTQQEREAFEEQKREQDEQQREEQRQEEHAPSY